MTDKKKMAAGGDQAAASQEQRTQCNQTGTFSESPSKNAFLITPEPKTSQGIKKSLYLLWDELKKYGCRYSKSVPYKGTICPSHKRAEIEQFLSSKKVSVSFDPIHDSFWAKTPQEQESGKIWNDVDSVEVAIYEEEREIDTEESRLEKEIHFRQLSENDSEVLKMRGEIQKRRDELTGQKKEAAQLRNAAHISEENQKSSSSPLLIALNYKEILNKEIPQRRFILSPWIPEAGIVMLFAPPGIGKTNLSLSIALTVASGGKIFDWEAPVAAKILYIDAEMHEGDLQLRIKKLSSGLGVDLLDPEKFTVINGSWQSIGQGLPDLSVRDGQQLIEKCLGDAKFLILDNLSTLCRTGKENEAQAWVQMQHWLLSLRCRGVTTLLVHHSGKSRDDGGNPVQRGSSLREVILDSILVLKRPNGYSPEEGCVFEGHFLKNRGFCGNPAAPFEVRMEKGPDDGLFWKYRKLETKNHDLIIDLYNDGMKDAQKIAQEIGITRQAVQKHLKKAKYDGEIE